MYPACMMQMRRDSGAAGDANRISPVFPSGISTERRYSRGLAMSFAATSASCARKARKVRQGDGGRTTPDPGRTSDLSPNSAVR